jgi:hypothetical protein
MDPTMAPPKRLVSLRAAISAQELVPDCRQIVLAVVTGLGNVEVVDKPLEAFAVFSRVLSSSLTYTAMTNEPIRPH